MALLLLLRTTRQQMVLDYLQKKGAEQDDLEPENVWGKEEEVDPGEAQGDEDGMDSAGNRTAPEALHNPEVLGQGTRGVQPPGLSIYVVVQIEASGGGHAWTCGSRWERLEGDPTASSTTTLVPETPESEKLLTKTGAYSTVPASSKVPAGAGSSEVEGGPHGDDLNRLWSSWIQSRTNSKNQHTKASGNSQRAVTFQGTSGGRSSSLPVAKEDPNFHLDPENRDAQELVVVAPSEEVFMVESDNEQTAQASSALDAS